MATDARQVCLSLLDLLFAERYLCAKLSQHSQRLKVEEIGPFNLTLPVRVQSSKLGQNLLLLFIGQIFIRLLLGDKVAVLEQLV